MDRRSSLSNPTVGGPLLLLGVQLVQRLAHDVVLGPVDGRAAEDVLRLGYGAEFRRWRSRRARRSGLVIAVAALIDHIIQAAVQRGAKEVILGTFGLQAARLELLDKSFGLSDGGILNPLEGLNVLLALVALNLQ